MSARDHLNVATGLVPVRAGPFSLIGGRGPRAEVVANGLVAAIAPAISTHAPAKTARMIASLFICIDTAVR